MRLIRDGVYDLIHSKSGQKFLVLDNDKAYEMSGEELICRGNIAVEGKIYASSFYRVYKVKAEENFINGTHLELHKHKGAWQGYVLPSGIPQNIGVGKIYPTNKLITVANVTK